MSSPGSQPHGGQPVTVPGVPAQRPAAEAGGPPAGDYATFNVLLDTPAGEPVLGFGHYADALTDLIVNSRAEFAVGIFGSWGSGKTTLMRAVERRLAECPGVIPVWFAAWRYEKDPNLLLPLLDVLREAVENEARKEEAAGAAGASGGEKATRLRAAARAIGRAGNAFLAGLTVSAGLAGTGVSVDVGRMRDVLTEGSETTDRPRPLSYSHDGFVKLRQAIEGLSEDGTRRVVIFIDDLDRCMPPSALEVLESMKLFFDQEGCVFVVGLDQDIVELAVAEKFALRSGTGRWPDTGSGPDRAPVPGPEARPGRDGGGSRDDGASHEDAPPALAASRLGSSGSDYIKKLFQVPFTLPWIGARELSDYLDSVGQSTDLSEPQRLDFATNVRAHFRAMQGDRLVNPREIKRLLNLYTLQLKMFSPPDGTTLNPNIVLALLCLRFHGDWRIIYDRLVADPEFTQGALRDAISDDAEVTAAVWLASTECQLSTELVEYLRGPAWQALQADDLTPYISASDSTWSANPRVLEARIVVGRLRRLSDAWLDRRATLAQAAVQIPADVDMLASLITAHRESLGWLGAIQRRLIADVAVLTALAGRLQHAAQSEDEDFRDVWKDDAIWQIKAIDDRLLAWHRYTGLGL